ncbi:mitochondrial ribosomal large subunit component [Homalodisca vitripennis]|nr:mitochondrial ribosomal large subunit component [Homalodisca vitripennis]KAG8306904.1 mitochondrial ribosomal large subunit component [Homalodisca vitripennis]
MLEWSTLDLSNLFKQTDECRLCREAEELSEHIFLNCPAVCNTGQGKRMGGGKGPIDHYVTPIKPNRVIVELAGHCEFDEVKGFLHQVAHILPFKAMAVSHEMLEEKEVREKLDEDRNLNEYTMKYLIQNNMGFIKRWCRKGDYKHFGKYI